jgi:hypothetical protein
MDFSDALDGIRYDGARMRRTGWNGQGMFVFLSASRGTTLNMSGVTTPVIEHAYLALYTAQKYVIPWLPSQTDLLADDWEPAP